MAQSRFLRLSGTALLAAGMVYLLDTALDKLLPQLNPGIGALVSVLGLIGLPGLCLSLDRQEDPVAQLSYALLMAATAGVAALAFVANLILPGLPAEARSAVLAVAGPKFAAIGLAFLLSAALFCIVTRRANPRIRSGAMLYLLGAVIVGLRPVIPASLHVLDGVLIGGALLIWGYDLVSSHRRTV